MIILLLIKIKLMNHSNSLLKSKIIIMSKQKYKIINNKLMIFR
jgi:hypothetical protein